MKKRNKSILIINISFLLFACNNKIDKDIHDFDQLKLAYAKSINLPVDSIGVLIYSNGAYCGTREGEYKPHFTPRLLEEPYKTILEKKYVGLKIVDHYSDSLIKLSNIKKISMEFWGTRETNDSIVVNEHYVYNNEEISKSKICVYKNEEWVVSIK